MAYLDLANDRFADARSGRPGSISAFFAPVAAPVEAPVASTSRHLDALQWSVVALARHDRLSTLSRPGRLGAIFAWVFGTRTYGRQLADPALEALRRAAVLYWHHGRDIAAAEIDAFTASGFTPGQYRTMTAGIDASRSAA